MKYEVTNAFRKWLTGDDFVEYKVGDIISLERINGVLRDKYGLIFAEDYIKPVENEWIPYDGKGQPVANDVKVTVGFKDYNGFPTELTAFAKDFDWRSDTSIMCYQLIEQPKTDKGTTTEKVYDNPITDKAYHSDKNVEALRELLKTRAETGFKKYGVTTERKDLTTQEWCQHAIEELLDGAIYLMRLKDDLKAIEALVGDKK